MKTATSTTTIEHLRNIFATHGLPEMLVTDNAAYFTSQEFQDFTKLNGIRHVTSAPYHPASNGLAERAVQTVKEFLKKPAEEKFFTDQTFTFSVIISHNTTYDDGYLTCRAFTWTTTTYTARFGCTRFEQQGLPKTATSKRPP